MNVTPERPDDDERAAAWLTRSRPAPTDEFVERLENRLTGASQGRFAKRFRPLVAGLGLSGALATVVVVLALAGGGPLQGNDDVKARQDCQTEQVRTTEPEPEGELVRRADGTVTVVTTERPVTREVTRCR